ncbi:hypothetical protein AB0D94_19785 [Streptomyces sp. NPDC048255]
MTSSEAAPTDTADEGVQQMMRISNFPQGCSSFLSQLLLAGIGRTA